MSRDKGSGDPEAGGPKKGERTERFSDLVDADTVPLKKRKGQRAPASPPPAPARVRDPRPTPPKFEVECQGYGARADSFSRSDFAKLRRGEIDVERDVDLHGLSAEDAKTALDAFLEDAIRARLRCVKVIHGQGRHSPGSPVLREAFPGWMLGSRFAAEVLAFAPAPRNRGGDGASLVRLRRQR